LTYDQMADDIKIMMDSLHIDSAYVWGQSDGGILALILASKYPAKIARLSTFGANLFPGKKAIYDEIEEMVEDTLKTTNNFQTRRLFDLLVNEPHITIKDLKKISAPALIMVGDRDVIRPEHTQLIFNNIPNANLFVMPGATHSGSSEKPDLFNMVLLNFFLQPFSQKTSVEMFTGKKPAK
jgi:pimeloyl-ACP methyl ester carboxylesterase